VLFDDQPLAVDLAKDVSNANDDRRAGFAAHIGAYALRAMRVGDVAARARTRVRTINA
jgi:hypothetical protein